MRLASSSVALWSGMGSNHPRSIGYNWPPVVTSNIFLSHSVSLRIFRRPRAFLNY